MKISGYDLAILLLYLGGMVAFGLWLGRGQKSSSDYMVGSRNVAWWVILVSIVATETSTVTFLSVPGLVWKDGGDFTFLQLPLGYIVGRLVVCGILIPRYFRGQLFTAYEVLHERFGGSVRRFASAIFIVTRTLGDGLRLFLSAVVIVAVFDWQIEYAVIGLGVATIVYTFVGGMRAVLWTDFIQFIVYMSGAVIAFFLLVDAIDGGWPRALELAGDDRLRVFDFSFDLKTPYLFWTGLIGGAVVAIGTHGVDQMMVQRYLCARNEKEAKLALALSGPVVFLQFAFFLLIGLGLYAFYAQNPQEFKSSNRVFATFIADQLPVGVIGIVLGAVLSAAMSTLSSSLNSASTALVNDFFSPRVGDDRERLRLAKAFTIVFGVAQIIVGISGQYFEGTPIVDVVLHIQSLTTGIILGVFCLGIFTREVGERHALIGLIGGLAIVSFVEFVVPRFASPLAWPWFVLVGSAATFLCGLIARKLLPPA